MEHLRHRTIAVVCTCLRVGRISGCGIIITLLVETTRQGGYSGPPFPVKGSTPGFTAVMAWTCSSKEGKILRSTKISQTLDHGIHVFAVMCQIMIVCPIFE
jgi:hypothetical protein